MCLIFTLLLLGPRAAIAIYWIAWPARWDAAFGSPIVPIIGFLFLPWATLTYLWVAPGGVSGFDYALLGFAVALDIFSLGGGFRSRRD